MIENRSALALRFLRIDNVPSPRERGEGGRRPDEGK